MSRLRNWDTGPAAFLCLAMDCCWRLRSKFPVEWLRHCMPLNPWPFFCFVLKVPEVSEDGSKKKQWVLRDRERGSSKSSTERWH